MSTFEMRCSRKEVVYVAVRALLRMRTRHRRVQTRAEQQSGYGAHRL